MKQLFTFSILLFSVTLFAQSRGSGLFEMGELVWTPESVDAICAKEDLRSTYGNDIAIIGYHPDNIQNGGDPMYNTISSQWADIFGVNQFGRERLMNEEFATRYKWDDENTTVITFKSLVARRFL